MKSKREQAIAEKDETTDLVLYRTLIASLIIWFVHSLLFGEATIGGEHYGLYVMLIPTIVGVVAYLIYRRAFLIRNLYSLESLLQKLLFVGFQFFVAFVFAFLTFGLVAHITWNHWNKSVAYASPTEIIYCEIHEFDDRKRGSDMIYFNFQDHYESISVSYQTIKSYLDKDPDDYVLRLIVREGVWQHYIIEKMSVERKNSNQK
ncbi:MAG: hypothetical protein AB8F95_06715 [Bacteroidia bacterium]